MKNTQKITMILMMALFLGTPFLGSSFAGTTATFTARCYMPEMVSTSNVRKVSIESQMTEQKLSAENAEIKGDNKLSLTKRNPNIIQQQEEIISENNSEVQLITTVCAK